MNLNELSLTEVLEGIKKRKFSPKEVFAACQKRVKDIDDKIKAFITIAPEIKNAIPFAIKDNFCTKDVLTTASSNVLRNYIPVYNATVYQRLLNAGFGLLGKTNMDSFAHGSSTETSDFFVTHNPWNLDHLPGGSSGGSAAAVMADETIFAIGSETAGSIRQPSAWCGVVGLKPTYGRVSRYGVIAMGSSLDCPGPITKTVADAEIVYRIIAGKDPLDATTVDIPLTPAEIINFKNIKIGVAKEYLAAAEESVRKKILEAIEVFRELGCKIIDISLFDPKYAISVYTILQRSEVSSNLARYDGIRYGFDRSNFNKENKRRIMLGTYTLSAGYYDAYYLKAQKIRTVICQDFDKAFEKVDAIIGPVSPSLAKKIGASMEDPMFGEKEDILVEPSTIAGLPAISLPAGFIAGLPVGLQIIANKWQENLILKLAEAFEAETKYYKIKPKI